MEQHELDAWLGPARSDLTDEQYERLASEAEDIERRYPDPDDGPVRDAALVTTLEYLLEEGTTLSAGSALLDARITAAKALAGARQMARLAALDGTPKAQAAREAGIDRMTLLKDLGER
ncbi:MAG: hypothetical protein IE923_07950 [Micrococcales bacterium]|nr:hypothetical protein [Micrococcales bacterium]